MKLKNMKLKKIKLSNMKIGKKLILTFVLISLISSVSGVVGFSVMKTMAGQYSVVLEKYGFSQGDVGLFNTEFNNNNVIMRDIILQGTVADKLKNKGQLDQSSVKLNQYLAKMKASMVSGDEQNYYNTILDCLQQYAVARDQVVQLAISEDSRKASEMMAQDCAPLVSKMRAAIDALVQEKTSTGDRLANGLAVQEKNAEGFMAAVVLFSILLSVVIAVLISRGISKPVAELLKTAEKIAQGDLKTQVTVKSENEIGRLAAAFAETVRSINRYITDIEAKLREVERGNLRVDDGFAYKGDFVQLRDSIQTIVSFINDTILQMRQASEQVASGAGQVSAGAQALAQGASEQVGSIDRLSGTIAEISARIRENTEQTKTAGTNAGQVKKEIETCDRFMKEMVEAMARIDDSSQQIEKVIKTIESIAFQTNILALNAAVEAARAGDAGKGFAVVADEVRSLAGKSSDAAKETRILIRNSMSEVRDGKKTVKETAASLLRVVESAGTVFESISRISDATEKQSEAVKAVNADMKRIADVVQTNSATAEESAAASEELAGQAQVMKSLSEKFSLREDAGGGEEKKCAQLHLVAGR